MKILLLFVLFLSNFSFAQKRVKKISLYTTSNFYSYTQSDGYLNNVVRNSEEGMSFQYKTIDTSKKKGMIYELTSNSTSAYYKNILGSNTILNVTDLHANVNFIFPMIMFYKKSMDHCLSVGIGIGTLAARDYLDESNNLLPYNNSNLKEQQFGKFWTSNIILDYEFDFRMTKKIGCKMGLRYFTPTPISSNNTDYKISQGTGIGIKYGLFYQFR